MNSNKNLLLLCFFILSTQLLAQHGTQRYVQHAFANESLVVTVNNGKYHFQPYTKNILKVSFLPTDIDTFIASHSVVQKNEIVTFNLDEQSKNISLSTDAYSVIIQKNPFSVSLKSFDKTALKNQHFFSNDSSKGFRYNYHEKEIITGGGSRAISVDRRGNKFDLYNQPHYAYEMGATDLNYSIPYFLSSELYSVLFDNPQKGFIDFGVQNNKTWEISFIGGELTYYFIAGRSNDEILNHYTKLTGRQPMPPRWALGNLTSRMAYQSEEETRKVVSQMQKESFPMDAIIIDLNWFGKFGSGPAQMGNLDWDKDNWPTAKKMISDFKKQNIKTILITEPYFVDSTNHYNYLKENKLLATNKKGDPYFLTEFFFGKGGLIDVFKPEAQSWFWKQYQKHIETGISGWWGDLGEPEHHPSDLYHVNGKANEVHNIYGHYWEKLLFEGYKEHYPDTRLFNLSRSGYAGSQRFSIFPWSGDVSRSWSGLQAQLPIMLTMSISGLAYMHSDLGGFALGKEDPELYTRWLQFGVFTPIFRPHGSDIPSEPIFWNDSTKQHVKEAIKLRYRLLPYNYTLAWENHKFGTPLARPIWYNTPQNKNLYTIQDTYYWGENLLIAPILKAGIQKKKIYLPKGLWFDFNTDQKHTGNQWVEINTTLKNIPVFAKGGSFIPSLIKDITNTNEYNLQKFKVDFYPSNVPNTNTKQYLYEDGGSLNNAYEKKRYAVFEFEAKETESTLIINIDKNGPDFNQMPAQHMIEFVLHDQTQPLEITVNGKQLDQGRTETSFKEMYYGYFYNAIKKQTYIRLIYMGVNKYEFTIKK